MTPKSVQFSVVRSGRCLLATKGQSQVPSRALEHEVYFRFFGAVAPFSYTVRYTVDPDGEYVVNTERFAMPVVLRKSAPPGDYSRSLLACLLPKEWHCQFVRREVL